ncbi:DUF2116 family Zn-ribbon domain-containing protein [Marinilongibacter aquaticus]|uniref:DUF2116 family Zn-ribbon domain-containing protein n=1 Tax=Marinilongibacter aquaticus TaxID=2975157 RepID=UPI0021BD4946|nr:DUF2116 family Zn-ribbon domain-containing protein [Marinilongibacter aquaticus]UBM58190.1 DUF2116 family Zn-ribbon domain-containing protein [Marinilongibacter aquaticus]
MSLDEGRKCAECGKSIVGRADKRFCSDFCRNTFNNRQNAEATNLIRNINRQLKKNRRILKQLCTGDKTKTNRSRLLLAGFDFKQITHLRKTKKGSIYYFVYDFAYLELENDFFLIVRDRPFVKSDWN